MSDESPVDRPSEDDLLAALRAVVGEEGPTCETTTEVGPEAAGETPAIGKGPRTGRSIRSGSGGKEDEGRLRRLVQAHMLQRGGKGMKATARIQEALDYLFEKNKAAYVRFCAGFMGKEKTTPAGGPGVGLRELIAMMERPDQTPEEAVDSVGTAGGTDDPEKKRMAGKSMGIKARWEGADG